MKTKTAYVVTTKTLNSEHVRKVSMSRDLASDEVLDIISEEKTEPFFYEVPLIGDEFLSTDIVYLAIDLDTDEFVGISLSPESLRETLGDDVAIIEA